MNKITEVDRPGHSAGSRSITASIVIPTKDRPDMLDRCLRAVLEQDVDADFEVIVVNDGGCSVDSVVRLLPGVRVTEGSGRGPAAARNLGLASASGEIVLFTDDDAVPMPGWIAAALSCLAGSSDAVGVVGRVDSDPFDPLYEHSVRSDGGVGSFLTCNAAYRRSTLEEVGGFDEGFPYAAAEDRDLGFRVQLSGPVLFERNMVVVHPPRPVGARATIRRARHIQSEWRLHEKHPQTRPPRWSIRWGPLVRLVRSWQRLSTEDGVLQGSPRRAARFVLLASGQFFVALTITLSRWHKRSLPPAVARCDGGGLRIAWIGPTPSPGGGVAGCAWHLVTGLAAEGCELDCYLADAHENLPPDLSVLSHVRVINFDTGWRFDRWYSSHAVTKVLTGQVAIAWARARMASILVEQHRLHPYDVVYQFSTIELFGLRRHLRALPPIVLHPETHMAGELRWVRRERAIAARCQPRWRRLAVEGLLATRARRQRRDVHLASRILAISKRFGEHLVADYGVDPGRLNPVVNPVDLDELQRLPGSRSPGPWRIAFVGRMSVRKGLDLVTDLSHRLADLEGEVIIDLVGAQTLWSDYRPLLADLNPGLARYRGSMSRTDLASLLSDADLLVQPAKYEPFGLTVAEALASGVPVVATDEVGAAEDVSADCCSVVRAGDGDALETAVRLMVERLAAGDGPSMARAARAEAERLFSPEKVVDLVFDALAVAASGHRAAQGFAPNRVI